MSNGLWAYASSPTSFPSTLEHFPPVFFSPVHAWFYVFAKATPRNYSGESLLTAADLIASCDYFLLYFSPWLCNNSILCAWKTFHWVHKHISWSKLTYWDQPCQPLSRCLVAYALGSKQQHHGTWAQHPWNEHACKILMDGHQSLLYILIFSLSLSL